MAQNGPLEINADPTGALAFTAVNAEAPAGAIEFVMGNESSVQHNIAVKDGGIDEQAERVMANLSGVVSAAGSSLSQVIKTTCFLADLADFPAFNAVYARWFGDHKPARSTVQVAKLPMGVLVEVECIARRTP